MESKILPSTGLHYEFGVEELYIATTHWLSDISFFEQEISYFQSLVERYFIPNVKAENRVLIESLSDHFASLELRKDKLKQAITLHQHQLSPLLHKPAEESEAHFFASHARLEDELKAFSRTLRQIKMEFFNATKFCGTAKRKSSL